MVLNVLSWSCADKYSLFFESLPGWVVAPTELCRRLISQEVAKEAPTTAEVDAAYQFDALLTLLGQPDLSEVNAPLVGSNKTNRSIAHVTLVWSSSEVP